MIGSGVAQTQSDRRRAAMSWKVSCKDQGFASPFCAALAAGSA